MIEKTIHEVIANIKKGTLSNAKTLSANINDTPSINTSTNSLSTTKTNYRFEKIKFKLVEPNVFQLEQFTKTQVFHKRVNTTELETLLLSSIGYLFKNTTIETSEENITFLTNKKGKTTILKKANITSSNCNDSYSSHNKVKNYLLPEGSPVSFLIELGVMTKDGKIINSKYDKFRQINRFTEYVEDILPSIIAKNQTVVRIIDFGCGKSYVTFAIYHYLTEVKKIETEIFGLDLKKDVIDHCNKLANDCDYKNLHFACGNIEEYRKEHMLNHEDSFEPDIVITLHACDTATDHALAFAIEHNAKAILSVPCCQHELNNAIQKKVPSTDFNPLLKYGIIKERFSALATDVIRAELLNSHGYDAQILEFIDMSHTPKNLLIRAIKTNKTSDNKKTPNADILQSAFGVQLTLEKLLT